jgi:drug/metabolite transporter (DMT)-like permease
VLLALMPLVPAPPAEAPFWVVVAIGTPLEILALVLYARALQVGSLSTALPLLALTPVLLLVTGPLIAGDRLRLEAIPGVLLVALGAWMLHLEQARLGWLAPLRALARAPEARLMLAVAAIYAVTSALGKRGVVLSSPGTMATYYFLAIVIVGVPVVMPHPRRLARVLRRRLWICAGLGVAFALHVLTHMNAVALMPVAEMISVKRLSMLFAALAGVLLLGEPAPRGRLPGAAMMVAGAVWIGLA